MSKEKKAKLVQTNKLVGAPCESNIDIVAEEHVSSANIHFDIVFCDADHEVGIYTINSSQ